MKPKQIIRMAVDIGMTVLLLLLMAFMLTRQKVHEWLGAAELVLFIAHHVLNARWLKNIGRGKYTPFRLLQTVLALLVLLTMLGSMVSGIMMSRYAFAFLDIHGGMSLARTIHMVCAYNDVDAVSSASVVAPGNAAQLASFIQQEVGGDLFSIVVSDKYPSDYDECMDRAADEKAENARPALSTHVSSIDDYDIVFLGFPNWWYTLPMPVLSFVDEYDWSGKTVIPFVTHGTGGLSATVRDLTAALASDTTVLDAIGVYRPDVPSAKGKIQTWIAGLDLEVS